MGADLTIDSSALSALLLQDGHGDILRELENARVLWAVSGTLLEVTEIAAQHRRALGARLLARLDPLFALGVQEVTTATLAEEALLLAIKHKVSVATVAPIALAKLKRTALSTREPAQMKIARKELVLTV